MQSTIRLAATLIACLALAPHASAGTISFTGLTDAPLANGEVTGDEFLAQGLLLELVDGIAFNVGCGTGTACLGADLRSGEDFRGQIRGRFVVPGTFDPALASSLSISFCCSTLDPAPTVTMLFGPGGNLVASFPDGDVFYAGGEPVAYFETRFGYDAMRSLTFTEAPNADVPEPSSLLLLAGGLAALRAPQRRRSWIRPGPPRARGAAGAASPGSARWPRSPA
jgi:hypothetical protein